MPDVAFSVYMFLCLAQQLAEARQSHNSRHGQRASVQLSKVSVVIQVENWLQCLYFALLYGRDM